LDPLDDVVTVRVGTGEAGQVVGDIVVKSADGAEVVPVRADVEPGPILEVDPGVVDFGHVVQGEERTATISVANRGAGSLTWKHRRSGDFFTAKRKGDELVLRLVGEPGEHLGSVFIQGDGGETAVEVRAEIAEKPKPRPKPKPPPPARVEVEAEAQYDVVLEDPGNAHSYVVLGLREELGLTLEEAKQLITASPTAVLERASQADADVVAERLANAGATVQIVPAGRSTGKPSGRAGTRKPARYDVVLVLPGARKKAATAAVINQVAGHSQSHAYKLVQSVPAVVAQALPRDEASFIAKRLESLGAKAELRPNEAGLRSPTPSLFTLASQKLRENRADPIELGRLGSPIGEEDLLMLSPAERLKLHLVNLRWRLNKGERVVNLALGSLDWSEGLVAVTDRRLLFVWCVNGTFYAKMFQLKQLTAITEVGTWTSGKLQFNTKSEVKAISKIFPVARKSEILSYVSGKISPTKS
jgi:ribosomal protein L7/L12